MPRQHPEKTTGNGTGASLRRVSTIRMGHSQGLGSLVLTFSVIGFLTAPAAAQAIRTDVSTSELLLIAFASLESLEILMLAIFGGAMSFALLSAFWLIRERGRMVESNLRLSDAIANLRMISDRNEALTKIGDQRSLVWNGPDDAPSAIGRLPESIGVPADDTEFAEINNWLSPDHAGPLENRIRALRDGATTFETTVRTKVGGVLGVVGSTSGSYAIVKFVALDGMREELAELRLQHHNLDQSFERIEMLLSAVPVPVWLRDQDGKLAWVNDAYVAALEMESPADVVAENIDLLDSEQRLLLEKEANKGKLLDMELPATVEGDRRKLQVLSIHGENGGAGMAIDKSDVDDVNRLLKETNENHSRMLDQLATAVAIFDKSQRLIFHNMGFQQLWKLDPGILEGNPGHGDVLDAMRDGKQLPEHPDWRKWRDSQLEIYTAIEPVEEWWHLLDGQTIRVVAAPRSQGGSTWIFENVTERLALESNYNALMRIQGETLDHLNDAVAVFGSNGQLKLFNPALEELWSDVGIAVQEGLHISRITNGWENAANNPDILQGLLGGVTGFDDARSDQEGRMQLSDGRTLHYTLVPLPDSQTMLTFVDVTASVNFEKALKERAEALEASDLLKSKFIQHVSYELRAPLTSISGFGEILREGAVGSLNAKQGEYVSHINESAGVLRAIVDDILDLASIDAGTMILEPGEVELDNCVTRAFESFADRMREKGLKAAIDIDTKSENVIADPDRLFQIIRNVVSNAINFSPDGGTISVTASQLASFHEIRIADQGPGIDPSRMDAIFGRFESQSAHSGKSGTGLGLSIVKGFLELHGGSVSIDETYTDGTCIVCHLPIEPVMPEVFSDPSSPALAGVA